ncbi:PREDICTED: uncharacterized protein LOC108359487 [Rhagoletis zephyria]|uniref:uncharacterized protein LOC108359487 n=1 Tax=Rhagoletis zephyria TaxID=28612 RepID=UPI00081184CA|nr:PREDICTED: uncharacterized protein LOC108359487 [Rhagoletis zephyria]
MGIVLYVVMGKHINAEGLKNSRIQKEQLQLCKIQIELETILGKVNEAINELKVEELQLKAGAATALSESYRSSPPSVAVCPQEEPSTSSSSRLSLLQLPQRLDYSEVCEGPDYNEDNVQNVINQQIIDLDMNVGKNNVEEEEDEDM